MNHVRAFLPVLGMILALLPSAVSASQPRAAANYTITASAGEGGSITPSGTVTVNGGGKQTFAIAPANGWHVLNLEVDGVSRKAATKYTFSKVGGNHTIQANFEKNSYTIAAKAGKGGSITPISGNVASGGSQTFTVTPAEGYYIVDVKADGASALSSLVDNSYTFTNVTAKHSLAATFSNQYFVAASAGSGGKISPSGKVKVAGGSSRSFTLSPAKGYAVADLVVDGVSQGAITSYTLSGVKANHTVAASFAPAGTPVSRTLTASAGNGGSISPSGPVTVASGGSQTFTITPDSGYDVSNITVDGASKGAVTSYTFSKVTADHTISAAFSRHQYTSVTLTFSVNETGTALPVNSVQAVVILPAGVSAGNTNLVAIGSAAGSSLPIMNYVAATSTAPGSVTFGLISTGGFPAGPFATLKLNVAAGSFPTENDFPLTTIEVTDSMGHGIPGATITLSAKFQ